MEAATEAGPGVNATVAGTGVNVPRQEPPLNSAPQGCGAGADPCGVHLHSEPGAAHGEAQGEVQGEHRAMQPLEGEDGRRRRRGMKDARQY